LWPYLVLAARTASAMGLHSSQVGKARPVALDHHRTLCEYAVPDVDEDDQIYRDLIPVLAELTGWVVPWATGMGEPRGPFYQRQGHKPVASSGTRPGDPQRRLSTRSDSVRTVDDTEFSSIRAPDQGIPNLSEVGEASRPVQYPCNKHRRVACPAVNCGQ
jgi:hypothetical protein